VYLFAGDNVMVKRVATSISGFDKLIEGGLPAGSLTLVSGVPGAGKSIFCMHMAYNVASKGTKALYISFEQSEKEIEAQMHQLGLNSKKGAGKLKIKQLDSDDPDVMEKIRKNIKSLKAGFVVVDSLASLTSAPVPQTQLSNYSTAQVLESVIPVPLDVENLNRMKVKLILETIKKTGATAILTSEMLKGQEGYSRDTLSEFLCDAVVVLHAVEGEAGFRTLTIPKIRLTKQKSGIYSFEIGKKGVVVKAKE